MNLRERVARFLFDNRYSGMRTWETRGTLTRDSWLRHADRVIAVVCEPEDGDVQCEAAERLRAAAEFVSPGRCGELHCLVDDLLDSRDAVDGAWGRKAARALLGLPQEAE